MIFDSNARLPLDSQLLATLDQSPILVITSPEADPARVDAPKEAGAETLVAGGATPADRITAALTDLGRREITSLFLEGGQTLAVSFAAADQVDESRTFIAPVLLGASVDALSREMIIGVALPPQCTAPVSALRPPRDPAPRPRDRRPWSPGSRRSARTR